MKSPSAMCVLLLAALTGCASWHSNATSEQDFPSFLSQLDDSIREFVKGNAEIGERLWSHEPDVTLIGGYGGQVHRGWESVKARREWAASQMVDGTVQFEELGRTVLPDIAWLVRMEHIRSKAPGKSEQIAQDLRVTMIFRREKDGWRVVHRHADQQTARVAP